VRISRNEQGELVIQPLRTDRGAALLEVLRELNEVDEAFVSALEAEQSAALPMQERQVL
jgi:antitoxin VapB